MWFSRTMNLVPPTVVAPVRSRPARFGPGLRAGVLAAVVLAVPGAVVGGALGPTPPARAQSAPPAPVVASAVKDPARPPAPARLDVNAPGPKLYETLCAACHGAKGEGGAADHAPSLVNPRFLESASDAFLREAIIHGRPGTSMGAYGKAVGGPLPDAATARLVAFLRSKGPAYHAPPAAGRGDLASGAAIYDEICKRCHGDATIRGEAVHLANPAFLAAASDAFIKYAVMQGRPGTKMSAYEGPLANIQIDDVVTYVRSFAAKPPTVVLLPSPTGHEPLVINPRGKDPTFAIKDGRFVSAEQVRDALAAKKRLVIADARPPSDWMRVHIPGAVSVPYHDMGRFDEIPKDAWVVAYCACPHHLSGEVVDALRASGHPRALVLDEGIIEWHRRGYPVVAAQGVTRPLPEMAPLGGAPAAGGAGAASANQPRH